MVKRIDALTDEQKAQMDAWADKWIEVGLRTGNADREKFERAAQKCYAAANIPWHGNVIWVPSPIVMAFAAPTADFILQKIGKKAVRDAVGGAVSDAVRGAVGGAVSVAVGGAVRDAVGGAVGGAVDGAVHGAVSVAVDGAVSDAVHGAVGGAVHGAVSGAVHDAVRGAVHGAVDGVIKNVKSNWLNYLGGQFWPGGYWWGPAFVSFFTDVCGLELSDDFHERAVAYAETVESACWWYPHRDFLMVCERPTAIHRELTNPQVTRGWGSHRLHCADGPAVSFRDGWGVYAIHGVQVPAYVVLEPEKITWQAIGAENNAEVRRIMIDRYGPDRYVVDSGAEVTHEISADFPMIGLKSARVLLKDVPNDEPIVYVDLLNSTPEPDGSVKRYMLRVDPSAYDGAASKNCHAAVASTWRNADMSLTFRRWQDYAPAAES